MKPSKQFCKRQIERMEGLPYYATIGAHGFTELVNALQDSAASEDIAKAAVDAILSDTSRASSTETNCVPAPGELRVWVESVTPKRTEAFCGECEFGWVREAFEARGMSYSGVRRCACRGWNVQTATSASEAA